MVPRDLLQHARVAIYVSAIRFAGDVERMPCNPRPLDVTRAKDAPDYRSGSECSLMAFHRPDEIPLLPTGCGTRLPIGKKRRSVRFLSVPGRPVRGVSVWSVHDEATGTPSAISLSMGRLALGEGSAK